MTIEMIYSALMFALTFAFVAVAVLICMLFMVRDDVRRMREHFDREVKHHKNLIDMELKHIKNTLKK